MKVRTDKLFPYPVLSVDNDSYINNNFTCETTFEYNSVTAFLKFQYELSDEIVLKLIEKNEFGLYFIIDCSETKYRQLFSVKLNENKQFSIEIPLDKLNGMFEVVSLIICNNEMKNYYNSNLNDLYKDESIVLPKYCIAGFTGTESFFINKRIDNNGDIPSIFTIACDEEGKILSFEPGDEIVTIYLPKEEYQIYNEYKGKRKRLKQLMINFPVLVDLIEILKTDTSYINKPWYNALDASLVSKGYSEGINSELFKNELATKIAQDLLGNLIQDAFKDFDSIDEE